jgi:hypothetical protein
MDLATFIDALLAQLPHSTIAWISLTVTIASLIAAKAPAPAIGSTGAYPILYGLLNVVALNVGRARNAAGDVDVGAVIATTLLNATLAPAAVAAPPAAAAPAPTPAPLAIVQPTPVLPVAAPVPLPVVGLALLLVAGLGLSACATPPTATQTAALTAGATTLLDVAAAGNSTVASLVTKGTLFCRETTPLVPLVVAIANGSGAPVSVTGATSAVVADTCAAIGGVPVPPPASPSTAPVVTVATTSLPAAS